MSLIVPLLIIGTNIPPVPTPDIFKVGGELYWEPGFKILTATILPWLVTISNCASFPVTVLNSGCLL